jgi:ATP-dependent Lon protease
VLPIGGLREKILGAKRAGIKHVIFPAKNAADMKDIAAPMKKSLSLHEVDDLDQVLDIALVGGLAALERPPGASARRAAASRRPAAAQA